ncbi:GntR family transcriptional regulator [Streptomyces sp. Tu 4128]|uniref:GntR family transcriptional regulator n=1 Tax=Streptomyces sp. Tu 4128 TaxID=1120314 RepID=UPI000F02D878|nr:GntR family transcriptional regulator [Streptomyces sp. Tu 4128]
MPTESPLPRGLLDADALPLYAQVAARLMDDITAGGARAGDRLPSERVLAERYAVSRVTMRSALADLANRGVIESSPARGWFLTSTGTGADTDTDTGAGAAAGASAGGGIAEAGDTPSAPPGGRSVQGFADHALRHGLAARTRVLASAVRPARVQEAEELRIAPGAPLFEMRRLRYLDDLVVVVEHNRLPLALCPRLADTDFGTASLYATLRTATPGQFPRVADYSVEARQPTPEERELLEITDVTPVLVATQLAYNQDARPLELTVAIYRGDRYRFRASITD